MKIAYFTTAQDFKEYHSFSLNRNLGTNTSNQVFHRNFIECLSRTNTVKVFSCRSDNTQDNDKLIKKEGNIIWNYLETKRGKIKNITSQKNFVKKGGKDTTSIAFVDTMNLRCMLVAREYCLKNRIPLIGIVTDNPFNISGPLKVAGTLLLTLAKKCNGYVCLTEALNKQFNKNNKPSILIKGLSRKTSYSLQPPINQQYFFYAGTLMKKYGICDLIEAFNSLNLKAKLVIAGHHEDDAFKEAIKSNSKIIFLGNIDNETVLDYEDHAIANINPRPYMEKIDKYSIPSKVVEYSSKNALVISGLSSPLQSDFRNSILWVNEKNSLAMRLKEAYNMQDYKKHELIDNLNSVYLRTFSFEANNRKLDEFINNILG